VLNTSRLHLATLAAGFTTIDFSDSGPSYEFKRTGA